MSRADASDFCALSAPVRLVSCATAAWYSASMPDDDLGDLGPQPGLHRLERGGDLHAVGMLRAQPLGQLCVLPAEFGGLRPQRLDEAVGGHQRVRLERDRVAANRLDLLVLRLLQQAIGLGAGDRGVQVEHLLADDVLAFEQRHGVLARAIALQRGLARRHLGALLGEPLVEPFRRGVGRLELRLALALDEELGHRVGGRGRPAPDPAPSTLTETTRLSGISATVTCDSKGSTRPAARAVVVGRRRDQRGVLRRLPQLERLHHLAGQGAAAHHLGLRQRVHDALCGVFAGAPTAETAALRVLADQHPRRRLEHRRGHQRDRGHRHRQQHEPGQRPPPVADERAQVLPDAGGHRREGGEGIS